MRSVINVEIVKLKANFQWNTHFTHVTLTEFSFLYPQDIIFVIESFGTIYVAE